MTATPTENTPGTSAAPAPVVSELQAIKTRIEAAMSLSADVTLLKKLTSDAEAALAHVHGAGKTLTADIKADWVPLLTIAVVLSLGLHVLHFVMGI